MRVVVLDNDGAHDSLADAEFADRAISQRLVAEIERAGHQAAPVRLPFDASSPDRIADAMLAASLTVVEGVDVLIGLRFPAHLVPHPNKSIWLVDRQPTGRPTNDGSTTVWRGVPDDLRHMSTVAASRSVAASRRAFRARPEDPPGDGIPSGLLLRPLADASRLANVGSDGRIVTFAGTSTAGASRAIDAMRAVTSGVRLVVAVHAGHPGRRDLEQRCDTVEPGRVEIVALSTSDQAADLVNTALAVADLDAAPASEARALLAGAHATKPLISSMGSGGMRDLLDGGRCGLVCGLDPMKVAAAFDTAALETQRMAELAGRAHERIDELGRSWPVVVTRLLQ